jgi:glycosyltransferase involved in cell wall biosynthesis
VSRLRVLHVITRMVLGGAQENTLATVAGLRARGHEVVLATGPSGGPEGMLLDRARELGVEPVPIPELVREVSPLRDATALARLYGLIRRGRFDVVHTHTSKAGVLGRLASRLARVPVVVHTPHGHVFDGYFGPIATGAFAGIERALARRTDALIAISEACRQDHLRLGVGTPGRFVTIPSGIPKEAPRTGRDAARRALGAADEEIVVGCVARLAPVKGQHVLLSAFARATRRHPRASLVLVGDGPARRDLQEQAQRLGLDGSVRFLARRDDVPEVLPSFDMYVQPSLNEGMGRALAKAMVAGLPVVATDAPGPAELVGTAGVVVPAGDANALAGAIEAVAADGSLRRRLGRAARTRSRGFWSEEQMVEAIEAVYLKLVGERHRGAEEMA